MKKLLFTISVVALSGIFFSFTNLENPKSIVPAEGSLNMPEDVKAIVDNSCYGCHNTDSKNDKGKKKLNFDYVGSEYSNIKSAGKLKEIAEEVKEGDMPPAKFLDHYPEKALDKEQKKTLSDWALEAAKLYVEK